mmetsp:Transcript_6510/g.17418  ORF Transcript_6510/g.17418 Transcript_6510/m.17418 type:complete len:252 (-) Transcript_6510:571-1326(-)|eukprot:CAMPEP_0185834074 /NCGR_PEP_ID=MMETSP1353-20130828/4255_1 /TAXON_ID=1077150 /ORGANISM="Erythrolobus australicus, Strain CCMP3124" /LENGTH=251 /DNA_ID=CAMNT_0028532431 /DNA_START=243 /DNA_END=998 /DNA_ORIENTATION=+
MSLKQPVTQVRLTNVAVVRLKRKGMRFEVACYRNKVVSWRDKTETDLDEVLQIEQVFTNVSKGVVAPQKSLMQAFGTEDVRQVCIEILEKGELQVSEKERAHQFDKLFQEIATLVAEKCVDPNTRRAFTVGMIERAMRETLQYSVQPNRNAKQQALEVIRLLQQHMDIERAQMEVRIVAPSKQAKLLKERLGPFVASIEHENFGARYDTTCLIDPGKYREIEEILRETTRGDGSIEVTNLAVVEHGEERLE